MPKLSIRDLDLAHKRVLIRVDFNVPLENGVITDDTRIRETIPTIEYALRRKARVILVSHLGRPKGRPVESLSLRTLVDPLRTLLDHVINPGENVAFSPDCIGEIAIEMSSQLASGQTQDSSRVCAISMSMMPSELRIVRTRQLRALRTLLHNPPQAC